MSSMPWSEPENELIVADYFSMLAAEFSGEHYNKAEHKRALQGLIDRSRGSIERKHQNISAVLKALGEVWIDGYKPLFNYQVSLEEAVAKHLLGQHD